MTRQELSNLRWLRATQNDRYTFFLSPCAFILLLFLFFIIIINLAMQGAPYRHVLLHGPPGTGKTLIARRLAECSGMDYAIMSGGDVGPLGEDAVNQLHGLFRWAARSRKGLLVFIDEAEAFLSARGKSSLSGVEKTHIRHALNALLYQTGTQSRSFMMVLATNRPEDLDAV